MVQNIKEIGNNGRYHSDGTEILSNGKTYKGTWKSGKKHGLFIYSDLDNKQKLSEEWYEGKIVRIDISNQN